MDFALFLNKITKLTVIDVGKRLVIANCLYLKWIEIPFPQNMYFIQIYIVICFFK